MKGPLAGNNPKEIFSTCRKIYIRKLIRDMLSGPYHIIPIKMTIRLRFICVFVGCGDETGGFRRRLHHFLFFQDGGGRVWCNARSATPGQARPQFPRKFGFSLYIVESLSHVSAAHRCVSSKRCRTKAGTRMGAAHEPPPGTRRHGRRRERGRADSTIVPPLLLSH